MKEIKPNKKTRARCEQKYNLKKKREKEKSLSRWESEGGMISNDGQKRVVRVV